MCFEQTEDFYLNAFRMITRINDFKTLVKHILWPWDVSNVIQMKSEINVDVSVKIK